MLELFGLSQKRQIGIDIGTSGIKIVEVEYSSKGKEPVLKNYVSASFRENLPEIPRNSCRRPSIASR